MQVVLTKDFITDYIPKETKSIRLHFEFENDRQKMTPDEFWEFCSQNKKLNAELTKEGEVIVMPPTGFETSERNSELTTQIRLWSKIGKKGKVTDSNGGFILPNGAVYAPDASWTSNKRLEQFTPQELRQFLPLCPDFVVEMTSPSDILSKTQAKMLEYLENGARLGWLIHPKEKQVFVYRPNREVEFLENPNIVSGEDVLEGFELNLSEIW